MWVQTLWCTAGNLVNGWVRSKHSVGAAKKIDTFSRLRHCVIFMFFNHGALLSNYVISGSFVRRVFFKSYLDVALIESQGACALLGYFPILYIAPSPYFCGRLLIH